MPNVFLTDPLDCLAKPALLSAIQAKLQGYMNSVAAAMRPADKIAVSWVSAAPTLTAQDLLVYYTPTDFSVVSRLSGTKFDPLAHSHWGFTFLKAADPKVQGSVAEVGSEVYPKALDADLMANLAFHEMMHNKLRLGNEMHNKNGLAQATVTPGTGLSPQNIADMAAVMRNSVNQWTGGFALMASAKQRRDGGDLLWYL